MRLSTFAAVLAAAGSISLASLPAEAQKFPDTLKDCKKDKPFVQEEESYLVPVVGGGTGIVKVMSNNWTCTNKQRRGPESYSLVGLADASGKMIVPIKYSHVLPYSTTGAIVHTEYTYYKNYVVGKGEGKEVFDFQSASMTMRDRDCLMADRDVSLGGVSAVLGEVWMGVGGGKSHVTLFSPEGKARKLEYMGGDLIKPEIKPAVRRIGDMFLARWRDEQGVVRSGILDLQGRSVSPVLGESVMYVTPKPNLTTRSIDGCRIASLDVFIFGPSLDVDPSKRLFGNLLYPVGRDGQPMAMPEGAIGMFPGYWRQNDAPYADSVPNVSHTWAVVFPKGSGFEFTLHVGTPSEALVAAQTGPRYSEISRTEAWGGMISAKAVADGKWRFFRPDTDIVVGEPNEDYSLAYNSAHAVLDAARAAYQQALAATQAEQQAARAAQEAQQRAEAEKQLAAYRASIDARNDIQLCLIAMPTTLGSAYMARWLDACAASRLGMQDLLTAEAAGVSSETIARARAAWAAGADRREREAAFARAAELERLKGTSSYVPGQWESAIRNAGNAAVDAINKSSDNWLQQRQDQYIADWQRSQRAY